MRKLLFVEDDPNFACIVSENLEDYGYQVVHKTSGEDAIAYLEVDSVDLVLMDVELIGKLNGFEAAEQIRKTDESLPIVFATARKDKEDIIRGFGIKNMDYVKKPYLMKEILLRIDALLGPERKAASQFEIGTFTFDPVLQRLSSKNTEFKLSNLESNLLALLCENFNKVVQKDALIQTLWDDNDDPKSKEGSLHNLIYNLRRYLKSEPTVALEVISKQGYRITTLSLG